MQPQRPQRPVMDVATPKRPTPPPVASSPSTPGSQVVPVREAPGEKEAKHPKTAAAKPSALPEHNTADHTTPAPNSKIPVSTMPSGAITAAVMVMIILCGLAVIVYFKT